MSWWHRLFSRVALPEEFSGELAASERVLASASVAGGGHVVVTSLGLWVPDGVSNGVPDREGERRIGWHLISTARWDGKALVVTEAEEAGTVGTAVLLADREPRRFALPSPGAVPQLVHTRVTRTVLASERREVPGGSAIFVRRHVPGRDGVQLQVRADPGTELDAVRRALDVKHPE